MENSVLNRDLVEEIKTKEIRYKDLISINYWALHP